MPVGEGQCRAEGNKRERKKWDNCNSIINKNILKKEKERKLGSISSLFLRETSNTFALSTTNRRNKKEENKGKQ